MTIVPMNCLSVADCIALGVNITTARRNRVWYPPKIRSSRRSRPRNPRPRMVRVPHSAAGGAR